MAVVETVALAAEGVREAFVLAVRLALDRTRALSAQGASPEGALDEAAGGELFERLQELEERKGEPGEEARRRSSPSQEDFAELERLCPVASSRAPPSPWPRARRSPSFPIR